MQNYDNRLTGILFVLAGALGFSAKAVLVKLAFATQPEIDVITLMALRMGMALPFFVVIALFLKRKDSGQLTSDILVPVFALGLLGYYLASYLDFWGLKFIPAGLERAILFTYPTIVVLLSALVYKTRLTGKTMLALVISYGGIVLAFSSYAALSTAGNFDNLKTGSLLVFSAAISFAIFILGSARMIHKIGSIQFTAWSMIVACIATLIHFFVVNDISDILVPGKVLFIAAILAIFSTVIPSFFIAAGIKRIGASTASIVNSTGPIITIILGYYLLDEHLAVTQFIGIILVIAGAALVSRK